MKQIPPIKIKTIILSIVIAIVISAFVLYLIQSIFPSPEYENFCGRSVSLPLNKLENQTTCESNNGIWIYQEMQCLTEPCPQGYCDYYSQCQEEYNQALNTYQSKIFFITIILGIITLAIGIITELTSVSIGLMLGSVFLIFFGVISSWNNLSNTIKTITLGFVLIVLIWLGYKKLKN